MFSKKRKKSECPKETSAINKAAEISNQYKQLSLCCAVLSKVGKENDLSLSVYSGGYRLWASDITGAGIDIEEVYEHIRKLARKKKLELEIELGKLDA